MRRSFDKLRMTGEVLRMTGGFLAASLLVSFGAPARAATTFPVPAHVVVVIEENHTLAQIENTPSARYMNSLFRHGALFTNAHGVTHPSLPNYLALFAGQMNTNGDDCPEVGVSRNAPNLATALRAQGRSFVGYADAMPSAGFTGCWAGTYARKHAPWVEFANVPASSSLPFTALRSYDALPTVAFVIPDVEHDMHDGTIAQADAWLSAHIAPLVAWAKTHDTLVILTWDEGYDSDNDIPTVFIGPMVKPGRYGEHVDHLRFLRTIEALYGLPTLGRSGKVAPIADCWVR